MTKAEYIERYGEEWYKEYLSRNKAKCKARYANDPEYRESEKERSRVRYVNVQEYREYHRNYLKERFANEPEYKEYYNELKKDYQNNDLNSNGKTKYNIRHESQRILFKQRKHTKFKDYEIHHAFGYDDSSKFIYIPKSLHIKIHQYLRDNNIDADSNHYKYISTMINECEEYTYISV